jgi:Fe-Mn family superoxide dismutase
MKKGGSEIDANGALAKKIVGEFGSLENWEKDFRAVGAMRGIGWVVLYYDANAKRLFNCWVNEHDGGHLSGAVPLLVMDVFEHAFMLDYGLKRAEYIDAFFKNMDWKEIEGRFKTAR